MLHDRTGTNISGSSNICSAMYECQISNTNFYPRTFSTFPNSSGDIMIYGQSDILSKYTDSFSLSSLNSTSMEGKILVKNPHGFSKVWKHFGFYKAGNKVLKDFAVCFVCKQECKYSGGTTNLSQHIEKHHSEFCGSKSIQSEITSLMKQPVVKLKTSTQSMFTESIAEYICGDLVSLSTVDSKHFKGMVKMVSGGTYECPSRKYFTETLLPKMMDDCTEMIKKEIQSISGIGLTTDSWTSLVTKNYIIYTAHYITKDWDMKSRVLSTQCSEERHVENVATDIKENEQKWGINKLLFNPIYVHNNATNVTKAPKVMENPRLGIGCLAHTINLAANSATSLGQASNILSKGRIVTAFKKSTAATIVLKKKQALLLPTK